MDFLWKELGMVENTKAEAIRVGVPAETNSVLSRSLYPNPFHSTNLILTFSLVLNISTL